MFYRSLPLDMLDLELNLATGVPQRFDEMSTLVRAVQEPPDIHSKL